MCGRYTIIGGKKVFETYASLRALGDRLTPAMSVPHYNAAPMATLPIVVNPKGDLKVVDALWWLVPHWSKTGKPETTFSAFNARAENLDKSKLFGPYFKNQRCLVPADAFFEWMKPGGPSSTSEGRKTPVCIRLKDDRPFLMAGLYSVWKDKEEKEHPSFSIITTTPNAMLSAVHNRMPVILHEKDIELWLDDSAGSDEHARTMLRPYPAAEMKVYRVTPNVSNSRYEEPDCIASIGPVPGIGDVREDG